MGRLEADLRSRCIGVISTIEQGWGKPHPFNKERKMAEIKCPMSMPVCDEACAWNIDGKCAVVVIAEKEADAANLLGAFKRGKGKK